jgi:hypothetical protein
VDNTISLLIPSSDSSPKTISLSRHQVWTALSENDRGWTSGCFPDVLLNAGGPVWAMDWLPLPKVDSGRPSPEVAYLALGCHPADSPLHRIGTPITGPHSIQIWEIPINSGSTQKPRLSILLQHDGGLAWHCQWCPRSSPNSDRLGLLVGVLGDGSVRIWSLPVPIFSASFQSGQPSEPQESSLTGSPEPVASIHPHQVGGSMASKVDWLPHHPCDRLVVASWDGSIYVTQLIAEQNQKAQGPHNMQVLCHFPADIVPLRTARWIPPAANAEEHHSIDNVHQNLFLTGGQEGILKLWDAR